MQGLDEVWEQQEEEDKEDGHQIHQQEQDDAAVVEAPSRLDASHGIEHAQQGEAGGNEQQQCGAAVREAGEQERQGEAADHQQIAAKQGASAQVEDGEGCERAGQRMDAGLDRADVFQLDSENA
jgi:hypothetical protein